MSATPLATPSEKSRHAASQAPCRAKRATIPRLINLLIEERAERIAATRVCRSCLLTPYASQSDRDQARREIEREVLTKGTP